MRTLPILFKTEMVQALLDGRKSCTRRVIKLPDNMTGRPIGKSGDSSNPLGFFLYRRNKKTTIPTGRYPVCPGNMG